MNKLSVLSRVVFLVQRFGEGQTNVARRLLLIRQVGFCSNIGISNNSLQHSSANDRISSLFDTNCSSSTKLIVRSYAKKSKSKDSNSKKQQQSEKNEEKDDDDEKDDYDDDDDDNEDKNAAIIKSIDTSDFKPGMPLKSLKFSQDKIFKI